MSGISAGLVKGGFDWKAMVGKAIFPGLASKLTGNEKVGQNV